MQGSNNRKIVEEKENCIYGCMILDVVLSTGTTRWILFRAERREDDCEGGCELGCDLAAGSKMTVRMAESGCGDGC